MSLNARYAVALAVISGALFPPSFSRAATKEAAEAAEMMSGQAGDERAAAAARNKDNAWKPACSELGLIQIGDSRKPGALRNFCLDAEGKILACLAATDTGSRGGSGIRVYSSQGELLKTMPLEIKPTAVCVAKDGSIFVAGDGRVLKLNAEGKVLSSADSPVAKEPIKISKETEDMVKQMATQTRRPYESQLASMKTSLEKRRSDVTGLTVTDQDIFMAVPSPTDFTFQVYRFDHSLQNPKLVVDKLRGCCGQMDIQSHGDKL
jgi:hypothetical protein